MDDASDPSDANDGAGEAATTAALVGATGGAGTTRLCVEVAATLARDGREVAVLDAAFATQGIEQYVGGHVERDVTRLVRDDDADPREHGLRVPTDAPGEVRAWPAYAAFEGIARAKTTDAAQRFAELLAALAETADHVLVDVPPVASNQAVAAVTSVERVGLVAPASDRGIDARQRLRGRLTDVGAGVDHTVANEGPVPADAVVDDDADVHVPTADVAAVTAAPVCDDPADEPFAAAVAALTADLFDATLELPSDEDAGLVGGLLGG
jgi:septum site-determining protein MinD